MLNFLRKSIKKYFTSYWFISLIVLTVLSVIPIIRTFGRLNIGHDTFIPLIPEFSYKTGYQWNDLNNGVFFSNNYFVWISIFHFFSLLGLNIYQTAFTYQFLIYFLSGLGIFRLYNLFNKGNKLFALLPVTFIILSPHYLDHMIYYLGTVGIIWMSYFLFKFIKFKKLTFIDIIGMTISISIIVDLPNPKYHFLVVLLMFLAIIFALLIKLISLKNIISNVKGILLLLVCTMYLTIPFLYFGYSLIFHDPIKINVKQGYVATGVALDYGSTFLSKIIRLFHSPNIDAKGYEVINSFSFFLIYYSIPIIVIGVLPIILRRLDSYTKRVNLIFYLLALFFLFLAKSSNPPFGFIYDYLLTNFKGFAFMRTTAGIVIFAAVFFSLIYGRIFQFAAENTNIAGKIKWTISLILITIIITAGYPFWSGSYYLNRSSVNVYLDRSKYGIQIPKEYFLTASFLNKLRLDTKVDIYPYTLGYQNNNWGYYGFVIYPWVLDKPVITFDKNKLEGKIQSNSNARYIYHDKTLEADYKVSSFWNKPEQLVFASDKIDIYSKSDSDYIPHFYTAKSVIQTSTFTGNLLKKIPKEHLAILPDGQNTQVANILLDRPFLEYKKINPTKYRLRIHQANGPFLLSFTENFHPLWKLYLSEQESNTNTQDTLINNVIKYYRILKNNANDQATADEVINYIKDGTITTLGDLKKKTQQYYLMNGFEKKKEYEESYTIEFISKNFGGTVQNDNLGTGRFYETFFQQTSDPPHLKINKYANGWFINPDLICATAVGKSKCKRLADGSHDFELIVEFWPQKLATMSYIISSATIVLLLFTTVTGFLLSFIRRRTNLSKLPVNK